MQSPTAPGEPTTSTSSPDSPITVASFASPSSAEASDPLVVGLAKGIADAINDFKRKLDQRDGDWANVHGHIDIALDLQDCRLTVEPDELGDEYPITVKINKPGEETDGNVPSIPTHISARSDAEGNIRRTSDSRQKRRVDEDGEGSTKRRRTGDDVEGAAPVITKEELLWLFLKLRNGPYTQKDTAECVDHVRRLLRRFDNEPPQPNEPQSAPSRQRQPTNGSMPNGSTTLSPINADRDSTAPASLADVVRREAKLLSSQIKWVEDCRRLASESHDQREETWRTSSAGFHDRARQNREDFQNTILHHQGVQGQTLQQILNEVKAIGLYAQSCKWEVPGEMPGRGTALGHHAAAQPMNVGHAGAAPTQGQQMHSYLVLTRNGTTRGSGSGSGGGSANGGLPPFPR